VSRAIARTKKWERETRNWAWEILSR
jgi:hypothetical protein